MELIGKAKEDFWQWINENEILEDTDIAYQWHNVPFSMKWGVYVDFFDSVGICLCEDIDDSIEKKFRYTLMGDDRFRSELGRILRIPNRTFSRSEARKEAIKKANELYNSQHPTPIQVKE